MTAKLKNGDILFQRVNKENCGMVVAIQHTKRETTYQVTWGDLDTHWHCGEELCTDKSDCEMT